MTTSLRSTLPILTLILALFQVLLLPLPTLCLTPWAKEHLTPEEQKWLQEHPVIRLAPDPSFKPIEFFDSQGKYSGIGADYVEILSRNLGIEFQIQRHENWDQVMAAFRERRADLLNAVVSTPQRRQFMIFPEPYLKFPSIIICRSDDSRFSDANSLRGHRVVMVSGYGFVDILRDQYPDIKFEFTSDISSALLKVSFGVTDAFVGDLATASQCLQETGITNLKAAGNTEYYNVSGFGIRSDWGQLKSILEKACAAITAEEKNRIIGRWVKLEPGMSMKRFWGIILIIGVTILLILGWFLFWNRILKLKIHESTQALEKSRTMMRNMIDSPPMWLACADSKGTYYIANKYYSQTFGIPLESIEGHNFKEFFPTELYERHKKLLDDCVETLQTVVFEDQVKLSPEQMKPSHIFGSYTPLIDSQGNCWGVTAVASDITEIKAAEEERARLENQLSQARKLDSIGRLAGGVAHDFNNMTAVILGYIEMMRDNLPSDSPLLDDLMDMEKAATRSRDLTAQLLAFSRKQVIEPSIIDLNAIIRLSVSTLSRLLGEDVQICFQGSDELKPLKMDSIQIDQILVNLAANARDAMPQGGTLEIKTSNLFLKSDDIPDQFELPGGDYILLEVSDNGEGMDENILANLFEPFFTTKPTDRGTGLGMATVYGIIRQNRGFIDVKSAPGKGSQFFIYFPAAQEQPLEKHSDPGSQGPGAAPESLRILLVEDEEAILRMVSSMLRKMGHVITATSSPLDAVEICRDSDELPDLIISDVIMPGISGREMYSRVSALRPGIPILYMSGYTSEIIARHGVLEEGIHFIQKPFGLKEMRSKIGEIVSEMVK